MAKQLSPECAEGRHQDCTLTMYSGCDCTYRGLHKTQHRYATIPPPSSGEGSKEVLEKLANLPEPCPTCGSDSPKNRRYILRSRMTCCDKFHDPAEAGVEVEREEFEAWHGAKYPMTALEYDEPENEYSDVYADQRWVGWQAARASRGEPK